MAPGYGPTGQACQDSTPIIAPDVALLDDS
jgi:hypothetical protein